VGLAFIDFGLAACLAMAFGAIANHTPAASTKGQCCKSMQANMWCHNAMQICSVQCIHGTMQHWHNAVWQCKHKAINATMHNAQNCNVAQWPMQATIITTMQLQSMSRLLRQCNHGPASMQVPPNNATPSPTPAQPVHGTKC